MTSNFHTSNMDKMMEQKYDTGIDIAETSGLKLLAKDDGISVIENGEVLGTITNQGLRTEAQAHRNDVGCEHYWMFNGAALYCENEDTHVSRALMEPSDECPECGTGVVPYDD
jgi:hypothetical protein